MGVPMRLAVGLLTRDRGVVDRVAYTMLTARASTDAIGNIESILGFLVDERIRLRRERDQAGLLANARAIAYWRAALTQRQENAAPGA